uniref:Putative secreted protein n=1 Tax=Anopheles triannulatus TaxID=58253 RepID=A0A2M4B2V0_9DIPT
MRHTIVLLSFHFLYSHAPSLARLAFLRIYIKPCNNEDENGDDNTHITLIRKALILQTTDTHTDPRVNRGIHRQARRGC